MQRAHFHVLFSRHVVFAKSAYCWMQHGLMFATKYAMSSVRKRKCWPMLDEDFHHPTPFNDDVGPTSCISLNGPLEEMKNQQPTQSIGHTVTGVPSVLRDWSLEGTPFIFPTCVEQTFISQVLAPLLSDFFFFFSSLRLQFQHFLLSVSDNALELHWISVSVNMENVKRY